jgi:Fe-S-cluster containining protein
VIQIDVHDHKVLAAVDLTLADAIRRSGDWVVCRPGCTQCCLGPFPINQLDARRLRTGLAALEATDPDRAKRIRKRVSEYPTNEPDDEVPCPVLDPDTGHCDLYTARPMTCRTFGPAVRLDDQTIGACELCYQGATEQQIAACAVTIDEEDEESTLLAALGDTETTVRAALSSC